MKYTVMGGHPGDGGVYDAESPVDALAQHVRQDSPEVDLKEIRESIDVYGFGDYEVKPVV